MLSYEYISFKVDWLIVSSQLYFTINLEEIFYFGNKKCRIYAAFGVSQTPRKVCKKQKELFLAYLVCVAGNMAQIRGKDCVIENRTIPVL